MQPICKVVVVSKGFETISPRYAWFQSSLSSSGKVETFVTDHTQIFEKISVGKVVTIIQLGKSINYGVDAYDLRYLCIDSQAFSVRASLRLSLGIESYACFKSIEVAHKRVSEHHVGDSCWAWLSLVGRLTMLTLLVVEGLELQSFSYRLALFLVAGSVFFLCLPCFSQSELRGGEVIWSLHQCGPLSLIDVRKEKERTEKKSLHKPGSAACIKERIASPYLFPRSSPVRSRLTSSHPDAILVTSYHAKPTSSLSSSSCSHHEFGAGTGPHRGPAQLT
eukprot:1138443-Pelagomonas_calceolata.AAC.7